jgi:hypothetical protein
MQTFKDDNLHRHVRKLEARLATLESLVVGLRAERRARPRSHRNKYKAVVTVVTGIPAGGSGLVTIYRGGAATSWTVTAHLNWGHGGIAIPQMTNGAPTQIWVRFYPDENKWCVEGKDCAA